ncbi:dTDP-4-dehydrorhamnose reductase [Acidisoma silvae]|uniref:dTDP-4-dehydrorhamnose reductase n=1 Tax=Acidisoma silvae TaxID=2802396 RepID=A0A963YUG9_9PROT|nr:dTDP-4-dehydrorhamnose reductase [Acidisoma silvae]MCB8876635.1 dTDP-4-dehydrorhamnose reductase [Acidisoma silvae]
MTIGPILVTGGSGQVAQALQTLAPGRDMNVVVVGRPDFDFDDAETLRAVLASRPWAYVVNAAAYTAVDAAEADEAGAERANRDGPGLLAELCALSGTPFIHISTDYVFDGSKGAPYQETDPTNPTGAYGRTKRDGEARVLAAGGKSIILRTAWVYADTGKNFVKTMLAAGAKLPKLRVVADQKGSPTAAADLAAAILAIIQVIETRGWELEFGGIYHATGAGETTWHGLAVATFAEAQRHHGPSPEVEPIATADWPTPAQRPADSRLDNTKLFQTFGIQLPDWRASLARTVDRLLGPAG